MLKVYWWPDGTWCYAEDLYQMLHKSDDFGVFDAYGMHESEIDRMVDDLCHN